MSEKEIPQPLKPPPNPTLFATGLNAHSQLDPRHRKDISTFRPLLGPNSSLQKIHLLFTCWSTTVIHLNGNRLLALGHQRFTDEAVKYAGEIHSAFGNEDGVVGFLGYRGTLFLVEREDGMRGGLGDCRLRVEENKRHSPLLSHVALAGNGRVAAVLRNLDFGMREFEVLLFESLEQFLEWFRGLDGKRARVEVETFRIDGRAKQLLAGTATFLLLTDTGAVYSWGDPRYQSLGRSITDSGATPAEQPAVIDALGGLKISKIACGGWFNAARSEDGAVYLWGVSSPGIEGTIRSLQEAQTGELALVDIPGTGDSVLDFVDVALGDDHIALVTSDSRLFVAGDNRNGQLGLGGEVPFVEDWRGVTTVLDVEEVVCGPKSTFVYATASLADN